MLLRQGKKMSISFRHTFPLIMKLVNQSMFTFPESLQYDSSHVLCILLLIREVLFT